MLVDTKRDKDAMRGVSLGLNCLSALMLVDTKLLVKSSLPTGCGSLNCLSALMLVDTPQGVPTIRVGGKGRSQLPFGFDVG